MIILEAVFWWLLAHPSVVVAATVSVAGGLLASIVVRVRAGGEHVCRLVDRPGAGWDEHPEELAGLAEAEEVLAGWAGVAASYREAVARKGITLDELDTTGEVVTPRYTRRIPTGGLVVEPVDAPGEPTATGRCRTCGGAVVHRRVPGGAWWTHVAPVDDHRVVIDRSSLRFADEESAADENLEATRRLSWAQFGLAHAMPPPASAPGGNGAGYTGRHHRPGFGAVTW